MRLPGPDPAASPSDWTIVRLGHGVKLAADTGVVRVSGRGSFHVDERTMAFLSGLHRGVPTRLASEDPDTAASLDRLRGLGIVATEDGAARPDESPSYRSELTDLTVRRPSSLVKRGIAPFVTLARPLVSAPTLVLGLGLLVASLAAAVGWIPIASSASAWAAHPWLTVGLFAILASIKALLHEAGHAAVVASVTGRAPEVGVGLYFTGPVMYVDMSDLDTESRRERLRGDVAGLVIDGYVVATVTAIAIAMSNPVLSACALSLNLVVLASLNPLTKSDLHWFLRDLFNARHVTTSWARPLGLLRATRSSSGTGRRFARVAVAAYLLAALVGCAWLFRTMTEFQAHGWPRIQLMDVLPVAALLIPLLAAHVARRSQPKDGRGH